MKWLDIYNGLMPGISLGLSIYNLTDIILRHKHDKERNYALEQILNKKLKQWKENPDKYGFR